jgi:hypothetical protein
LTQCINEVNLSSRGINNNTNNRFWLYYIGLKEMTGRGGKVINLTNINISSHRFFFRFFYRLIIKVNNFEKKIVYKGRVVAVVLLA